MTIQTEKNKKIVTAVALIIVTKGRLDYPTSEKECERPSVQV
jgi:hypothetical protein